MKKILLVVLITFTYSTCLSHWEHTSLQNRTLKESSGKYVEKRIIFYKEFTDDNKVIIKPYIISETYSVNKYLEKYKTVRLAISNGKFNSGTPEKPDSISVTSYFLLTIGFSFLVIPFLILIFDMSTLPFMARDSEEIREKMQNDLIERKEEKLSSNVKITLSTEEKKLGIFKGDVKLEVSDIGGTCFGGVKKLTATFDIEDVSHSESEIVFNSNDKGFQECYQKDVSLFKNYCKEHSHVYPMWNVLRNTQTIEDFSYSICAGKNLVNKNLNFDGCRVHVMECFNFFDIENSKIKQ